MCKPIYNAYHLVSVVDSSSSYIIDDPSVICIENKKVGLYMAIQQMFYSNGIVMWVAKYAL